MNRLSTFPQPPAPAPDTEQPLPAGIELVRRLNEANVRYGIYESPSKARAALAGIGDLDLLVAAADIERFRAVVCELQAIPGHYSRFHPHRGEEREHWFVPDFSRADFIHLDVSTVLRVGRPSGRRHPGVRYEDVAEWQATGAPLLPIPAVSPQDEARIAAELRRGAQRLTFQLRRLIYFAARKLTAFSEGTAVAKRPIGPRGTIVALVGPDGVGKSSQVARLASIFRKKFRCTTLYLGTGAGGWRMARGRRRRARAERREPYSARDLRSSAANTPKGALRTALRDLAVALERYATIQVARCLAAAGAIVISDRWPQNLRTGVFDGPHALPHGASPIVRLISRMEHSLYRRMARHKPELTIQLMSDFATSNRRKPDDLDPSEFNRHLSLLEAMRAENSATQVVDARKGFDEVTRDLFRCVWLMLRMRSAPHARAPSCVADGEPGDDAVPCMPPLEPRPPAPDRMAL